MAEETTFACPTCGKAYRWRAEWAGRSVTCKACSTTFIYPGEGEAATPAGGAAYEVAEPPPNSARAKADCPGCGAPVAPGAIICVGCGYNLRGGSAIQTRTGAVDVAAGPSTVGAVFRWAALACNGLLLIAGAANVFFGNCCMGVVAVPLGIYNFIMLLNSTFDPQHRVIAIIVNALTIGAGLAGVGLALLVQRTVGQQLVDVPQEFHFVVVVNSYLVAGALVLAGAVTIVAAALRPAD